MPTSCRQPNGSLSDIPTVADYVLAFGREEAVQLSNIDDSQGTELDCEKLVTAIEDAAALVYSYYLQTPEAGKVAIIGSTRRACLLIARYYLHTIRRSPEIEKDYLDVVKMLDSLVKSKEPTTLSAGKRPIFHSVKPLIWTQETLEPYRRQRVRPW